MKIMVTGATGFVGRHVVPRLLSGGHDVVAVARDEQRASEMLWSESVTFRACDLHEDFSGLLGSEGLPDVLIHLAWPGLPNYSGYFHIGENLPADLVFLEAAIKMGIPRLIVAGTCLEYGLQSGELTETMSTSPTTAYGFAKDALRKSLEFLQHDIGFSLQWMRLFYMYGEGQASNSLFSQLNRAIDNGDEVFNMSEGSQLRDYLSVGEVARFFSSAVDTPDCTGVINCCSGVPVSIIDMVRKQIALRSSNLLLDRGFYSMPEYEPLAFWGGESRLAPFLEEES